MSFDSQQHTNMLKPHRFFFCLFRGCCFLPFFKFVAFFFSVENNESHTLWLAEHETDTYRKNCQTKHGKAISNLNFVRADLSSNKNKTNKEFDGHFHGVLNFVARIK